MLTSKPPVIFLMGPTASGKTDLAIALMQHFDVELISVDSALIYQGMDIGTAKPSKEVLEKAPHRMIDICDPADSFTVADFIEQARQHIDEITAKGNIPLLVGGSMLYFKALLDGLAEIPEIKPEVRSAIESKAKTLGWPALYDELRAIDPEAANSIHPNHSRRIQRALEVYESTGETITHYRQLQSQGETRHSSILDDYKVVQLAILPTDRAQLHQRINQRFKFMLEQGFEEEVKVLFNRDDLNITMPSMRSVGYQQMWRYLDGETSYDQMQEQGMAATRQLAKRQLTWLRKWDELFPISVDKEVGESKIMQQYVDIAINILVEQQIPLRN